MAANADRGVERAARLADAWLMNPHTTLATLERQQALFHATRRALGRPAARAVPLIREGYVAPAAATAVAEAQGFLDQARVLRSIRLLGESVIPHCV
jgi:hypothetical protein